ncbi:MAG: M14 metallopeptidase family protein [Acidobacteriota bacterium]
MPLPQRRCALAAALCVVVQLFAARLGAQVPAPAAHFGFRIGSDGRLADADGIERYFETVAARSDRVRIVDLGPTTGGRRTLAAIVSAPDNIRNLDQIQAANQRLADPRRLTPDEARRIAAAHPAIVAIGGGIHASEVGATQAAIELLYEMTTSDAAETLDVLRHVVLILIPSFNPDGHRLVVDWYRKMQGTPFEGGPMPWLYHQYAGHDLNRDAFMMNTAESRSRARFFYTEWHPQVLLSMHQMDSSGPRMFVPPVADPIDRNYDPIIWREAALLGGAMALELQRDGRAGVVSNAIYDYYWPGYEDSAPLGHNTVCLLTEVARVRVATPITVTADQLRGVNGPPAGAPQINLPDPWPGGPWTLRDIVDYELSAARGLLHAAAAYRERIVQNFYDMGRRAVEDGQRGGPFAFVIAAGQFDPHATARLEQLLLDGRIELHRALEPFVADGQPFPAGTDIVLLAQPYRAYVKTLLERQDYPARRPAAGGPPERPYDVAGWTLPAQMGVEVRTIARPFDPPRMERLTTARPAAAALGGETKPAFYLIDARGNGGAIAVNRLTAAGAGVSWLRGAVDVEGVTYPAGTLLVADSDVARPIVETIAAEIGLRVSGVRRRPAVAAVPIGTARIALYRPWTDNNDEGWTRWLLDQYEFKFASLADAEVRAGGLRRRYDAIILPSAPAEQLRAGNPDGEMPPEYEGGLGEAGVAALKAFVAAGGTLICLDQAGGLAIADLGLPVRDIAHQAGSDEIFCPGSILRIELDPTAAGAYGMPPQTAGFFAFSSAYEVTKGAEARVRVVARYGQTDLLVSGWLEGEAALAGRPAAVEVTSGAGRVILLGFPVQHRGQSDATFRLLFNALFTAR